MLAKIKRSVRGTLVDRFYYWLKVGRHEQTLVTTTAEEELDIWEQSGRPIPPPPIVKQQIVLAYGRSSSMATLIETGTFKGDMIMATKDDFKHIHSIELSSSLYKTACERFADCKHVRIYHGDSAKVLQTILAEITDPCIFWLDAHYSGGNTAIANNVSPIIDELEAIFSHFEKNHVILIDDARLFTGGTDYPSLASVKQFVQSHRPGWKFEVLDDVIRVCG